MSNKSELSKLNDILGIAQHVIDCLKHLTDGALGLEAYAIKQQLRKGLNNFLVHIRAFYDEANLQGTPAGDILREMLTLAKKTLRAMNRNIALLRDSLDDWRSYEIKLRRIIARPKLLAERPTGKTTKVKRRRGAKQVYDPVKDKELVDNWRNSNPHMTKAEHERAGNLPAGDIQRAIDRLRKQ